jgi:hypothetical protein
MGKTFSDMIGNLETVIARIQNAGLKLKAKKCKNWCISEALF